MARAGKHVPLRRCVVCREVHPKAELLRLVRDAEGDLRLDLAGKAGGRGLWICRACTARERDKRFRHAFRGQSEHVRDLLDGALGHLALDGAGSGASHAQDGGMNER